MVHWDSREVLDIAVRPTDGEVWLATNRGLTRYSPATDSWSYLTRADGLPTDELGRITFDQNGDVFIATLCDGLTMKRWRRKGIRIGPPSAGRRACR